MRAPPTKHTAMRRVSLYKGSGAGAGDGDGDVREDIWVLFGKKLLMSQPKKMLAQIFGSRNW